MCKLCVDRMKKRVEAWFQEANQTARGPHVVCSAALAVFEAIRSYGWPIERKHYISDKNQILMSSSKFRDVIKSILGDERARRLPLPREGGRTTRSAPEFAAALHEVLKRHEKCWTTLEDDELRKVVDELERAVIEIYERNLLSRSGIRVAKPPSAAPISSFVRAVVDAAGEKRGAVVHHLVGTKLALRFGDSHEGLHPRPHTAADAQAGLPGDYWLNDAVFHATVSPTSDLFKKCVDNLARGKRVWVITLKEYLERAAGIADDVENGLSKRIQLIDVATFVGQNLEELGEFSEPRLSDNVENLVKEYNRRIDEAENGEPGLKIEFGGQP